MRKVDFRPFPDEPGFREALLELADEVLPGTLQRAVPSVGDGPVAVEFSGALSDDELRMQASQLQNDLEQSLGEAFAVRFCIGEDDGSDGPPGA